MNHVDGIYYTEEFSRVRLSIISGKMQLTVTAKTGIHNSGFRELTIHVGEKLYASTNDSTHVNMRNIFREERFLRSVKLLV